MTPCPTPTLPQSHAPRLKSGGRASDGCRRGPRARGQPFPGRSRALPAPAWEVVSDGFRNSHDVPVQFEPVEAVVGHKGGHSRLHCGRTVERHLGEECLAELYETGVRRLLLSALSLLDNLN